MSIRFGEPAVGKVTEVSIDGPLGFTEETLLNGYTSVAHSLAPKHPLQLSLAQSGEADFARRKYVASTSLGLHMGIRLDWESSIAEANGRIGGLGSKLFTKDLLQGTEDDIDIGNVFRVNPTLGDVAAKQAFKDMDI